jgi:gamma-glutamyltranspeptidase/glutathione hydrolase
MSAKAKHRTYVCALLLCLWAASASAATNDVPASSGDANAAQSFKHAIVVAANPLAAQAGLNVLRAGGSAADAAVAVQAMLGLVEPQSSGLGGGGFITYYDAATKQVRALDGREVAPLGATPDMFLGPDKKPLRFMTAVLSGRSTGVPGAIAALAQLQREHGKLAWRDLFGEAEHLASEGFLVSPRLAGMISGRAPQAATPDARRYFTKPDGSLYGAGDLLKNPAYAESLKLLADQGVSALYHGRIAEDIVNRLHQDPLPGTLSLDDLARYRVIETPALCRPWAGYRVCVPPPPSGGIGVLEGLLLLEHTDIAKRGPSDPLSWVELAEAERLMYADRDQYVGDPAFVKVPVNGLLDSRYIGTRAQLVSPTFPAALPAPGRPAGAQAVGRDCTTETSGTSEFLVVDAAGNVVSMTTTVESVFGSGRMVDGFFLNNQLTDFNFAPLDCNGQLAANSVAPGKRPRSAMSPTIVLDASNHAVATVGTAGGPAIIAYIMKTLVGVFDWHLSMQASVALPNLVVHGRSVAAETSRFDPNLAEAIEMHGLDLRAPSANAEGSGLHGMQVLPDGTLAGGADPRREGVALGY